MMKVDTTVARAKRPTITALVMLFSLPLVAAAQTASSNNDSQGDQEAGLEVPALLPEEGLFRYETWADLGHRLLVNAIDYFPRLITALLLLVLFFTLSRVLGRIVAGILSRTKADPALCHILSRITRYAVLIVGAVMAISQAGIAVGPLLASVGVLGLAIGLAAQDSLANLVAGLTILWDRPFSTGDRVTIADTYGEVTYVSIRTTTVRTLEHRELIIPNKEVIDNVIINHSRTPDLRLSIPIGIGYAEDTRRARDLLLEVAAQSDYVDHHRECGVVVTELAESSVNLELRVWLLQPKDERRAFFELIELSKRALDEAGVEIPFPQRVLHLESASSPIRVTGDGTESESPRSLDASAESSTPEARRETA